MTADPPLDPPPPEALSPRPAPIPLPADPLLAKLLGEAILCQDTHNWNGAIVAYKRIQRRFPGFKGAWTNASTLLCDLGRFEEAIPMAERALEMDGGEQAALFALLNARIGLGLTHGDEYRGLYDRALRLEISAPNLLAERGCARLWALDLQGAEADFRAAMGMGADGNEVRMNLATALLLQLRYREAWKLYRPGMALGAMFERYNTGNRRWDGGPMPCRTLMVRTYRHGFGDVIQFSRFLPRVREASGARVLLSVYGPMMRLAGLLPGVDGLALQEAEEPPFDAAINLMELPVVLGIDQSALPPPAAIAPPPGGGPPPPGLLRPGLKVGLAWAGSPAHATDARRSMGPRPLDALAGMPGAGGVVWCGLQVPPDPDPPRLPGFVDLSGHMGDFMDTARMVARMDMVAAVDTATLHLAASMGVPTLALLPHLPEWRWNLGGATPWYPAARLLRQPSHGDWGAVVGMLAAEIAGALRGAGV